MRTILNNDREHGSRTPTRWVCLLVAVAVCLLRAPAAQAEEPTSKSVTAELKAAIDRARDRVFPALVSVVTVRE